MLIPQSTVMVSYAGHDYDQWQDLLDVILLAFDYMDGLIDPPSSARRLDVESLKQKAAEEQLGTAHDGNRLVGCAFFKQHEDSLYIGKVAVLPDYQSLGIGRRFFSMAEELARSRGISTLQVETRVELTDNHAAFSKLGYTKTGENAHAGHDRPTSIVMTKILAG